MSLGQRLVRALKRTLAARSGRSPGPTEAARWRAEADRLAVELADAQCEAAAAQSDLAEVRALLGLPEDADMDAVRAELRTISRSRDFYLEQAKEAYRALRSPHAKEFTTQTHRTHGGEIASALRQAERDRAALKQTRAEFEAMRLELEALQSARTAAPRIPAPFGGRKEGDRCYCSPAGHLLRQPFAEGNSYYLQCPLCRAGYNEAGQHLCPTCGVFDGRWDPGTDHDPRSTCHTCGNFSPGWGPGPEFPP